MNRPSILCCICLGLASAIPAVAATTGVPDAAPGAALSMSPAGSGLPDTVTLVYTLENLSAGTFSAMSIVDDLSTVFGTAGVDWAFTSVTSSPVALANPGFDGSGTTELLNQAPPQTLAGFGLASVTVTVQLLSLASADINGDFCHQFTITGENPGMEVRSDLSHDGADPDPNGDNDPEEQTPSCFNVSEVPVELLQFSID